ncbi:hypothetical protein BABINDRAFT_160405 [Babjeviella inositovora NRRL Y-12698]|uniref:alcohol dehydrogenase (NADP(+)) n=1 Tax=Babjeviella inositovora NRRL Y-12698 TaxID=984486 RepID=A0A1E3QTG9_9ASCO|nr:uncharacterized protein BABINDRAFT_160405 [Babjeviella inositovora NRRL Y-12698]ODQ80981.1 hypothetical protein BABINDRAFT_160405 [Babjeviella inositovora NRRL Y-12698]
MVYPDTFQGYAIHDTQKWSEAKLIDFVPKTFESHDIDIEIQACGVCGSDVHQTAEGWGKNKVSPLVVGHEIIGKIVRVGAEVDTSKFKLGDRVGVGAQVWACLKCDVCKSGNETYCPQWVDTYNDIYPNGEFSHGGYASHIRVHEYFVFRIPASLDTNTTAPLLCAGITVYSPMKRFGVAKGKKVGVVGIGGLGHAAIMLGKAMGAEVYAFSRNDKKKEDALKLGADHYITTEKEGWNEAYKYKLDVVICTADSVEGFDLNAYLSTLNINAVWVNVGLPDDDYKVSPFSFIKNGCLMGSTHLGSRHEMEEMLELAAAHNVKCWVEEVPISEEGVKQGLEKCMFNHVRYRTTLTNYDQAFKR